MIQYESHPQRSKFQIFMKMCSLLTKGTKKKITFSTANFDFFRKENITKAGKYEYFE